MSKSDIRISGHVVAGLKALIAIAICAGAIFLIHREVRTFRWHDVRASLAAIPHTAILASALLTALNYAILTGYDLIAVRALGHPLPFARVALASFTGFVAANNFGALFGGTPVRARLYSAWGFSAGETAHLIILVGSTFWLGLFALSGAVFLLTPFPIPAALNLPFHSVRPLGAVLALLAVTAVVISYVRRQPVRIAGYEFTLPAPGTLGLQFLVATADFLVAASCLYVLLPSSITMSFPQFLGVFLLATVAVVLTNVPGGVGVFEAVIITFSGSATQHDVLASLLVFRVIYYLCPLAVAMVLLMVHEVRPHLTMLQRVSATVSDALGSLVPRFLALGTMIIGAILLFSGATPPISGRLELVEMMLPLSAVEASHFLASLAGGGLLLLGRGLMRRLDGAWWGAVLLLGAASLFSLAKGLDYEEAFGSTLLLLMLVASRKEFYRHGSILHPSWTSSWIAAVTIVVVCSVWLAMFAHQHVEYSHELWWKFAFDADAPRALRAEVAVMVMLLAFAGFKLFSAAYGEHEHTATPEELELAAKIISASPRTAANLALLGDKALLFNEEKTAFLMYGVQSRSWTVMGDPVGPVEDWSELMWEFREHCDKYDAWPVFYQVAPESIPKYVDQGFVLLKLGEEARVDVTKFTMDGKHRQSLRTTCNKLRKDGCEFSVISAEQVREVLPRLRVISDKWLEDKQGSEKGFSLGFYDEAYLARFPCAIVRFQGEIVAFANLWLGAGKEEYSIDLMRHLDTPKRMMDFLFVELIAWGKQEGYRWFNMGMAPLSGIESHELSPAWNKMAALLFKHGDRFYSFEGLREYKNKFDPVWTPRYLAAPGGLALPRILADVTRLIARTRD
ncbi:bifunctional lysylphosphatidylglycerol flippase/synthetase MprF [Planctomicrobium piriforme]|uniref:Phosphatidylglycerol lysyltransferase n=1 Tax=Planctomicrobium piriforme TaxID=1576369 RepID=A0A1I3GJG9_9PLAN|nr:bifunctional lysylphosphatidylglycerol flippase/synthetase MprF [Planctomicrobium piriforme]SFI23650.1 phosphatidylglycerol lysyltransferase [Planctomicrobium piriforme]